MVQPSLTQSENPFENQMRLVKVQSPMPFDPSMGHFSRSLNSKQLTNADLIQISHTSLFSKAIDVISDGVVAMPWTISPEDPDMQENPEAIKKAKELTVAMECPNQGNHDSYEVMVRALIRDLLVFNVCVVERQPAEYDKSQPFWLWDVSAQDIELDPDWNPKYEGIWPRFWFAPKDKNGHYLSPQDEWRAIYNRNMFFVTQHSATYELVPPSPVKLAYEDMTTFLRLRGYQDRTVSNPVRDYMISIENAGESELDHFREYWNTHVVGTGEVAIVGGKVDVVKFGAKGDDELFLKFADWLAGLIALRFGLSKEEFGISPHDNRATRKTVADISFQQSVLPIAKTLIQAFDKKVIKFYAPGFTMALSDSEPRNEGEEADTAEKLYKAGVIKKNEARKRVGEEPVAEGGDEFAAPQQPGQPGGQPSQPVTASKKYEQLQLFPLETYDQQHDRKDRSNKGRRKDR